MHSHNQFNIALLVALVDDAVANEKVKHDNCGVRFPLACGEGGFDFLHCHQIEILHLVIVWLACDFLVDLKIIDVEQVRGNQSNLATIARSTLLNVG